MVRRVFRMPSESCQQDISLDMYSADYVEPVGLDLGDPGADGDRTARSRFQLGLAHHSCKFDILFAHLDNSFFGNVFSLLGNGGDCRFL